MSLKKNPPRTARPKTFKNSTSLSGKKQPVKECRVILIHQNLQELPEYKGNCSTVLKLPVYKQQLKDQKSTTRKTDQYEFDSDSEKLKKRKKRKLEDSTTEEYTIPVKKLVKNVNQVKKKNKNVILSDNKKSVRKQPKSGKTRNQKNSKNAPKIIGMNKENVTSGNVVTSEGPEKLVCRCDTVSQPMQEKSDINQRVASHTEISKPKIVNEDDGYFGFSTLQPVKSSKIKIISDIQLKPNKELNFSIASPRLFKESRPNANSTLLNNVLTPWRFSEINIRRNPHFLTLKQSSLPCISQEMVLDHTLVDKLNESSKVIEANVLSTETKKTPRSHRQSKIDDYISLATRNTPNDQNQVGLFDIDQLSPIKYKAKSPNKYMMVRRKILCENNISENVSNQNFKNSTPLKSVEKNDKENTSFGFNSLDESDKENSIKEKHDKPFRLSMNINDKKYDRKKKVKFTKEEPVAGSDGDSDTSESSDTEHADREIKLFEDFEETREFVEEDNVIFKKRTKKFNSQKPKKRKDIRSKEEEQEAEQWAAAFNSMCEEIEQFPLEIE